ncbi:MAG TPA: TVP38/TMEM64 family protein [Afifellaceae bacterium]|nr:TVP38/TMEM64 family protein [Afifellaceae bacterium]
MSRSETARRQMELTAGEAARRDGSVAAEAEENGGEGTVRGNRSGTVLRRLAPVGIVALLLAVAYALGLHQHFSLEELAARREALLRLVAENWLAAAAGFVAVYVTAISISIPGASILTIAGGLMFGWLPGAALSMLAATIGATIVFLIARTALGGFLEAKAGPRLKKIQAGFAEDAFNYLLFLRLVPIFPFWVVNVAPALVGMRLRTYVFATIVGIFPGSLAYSYFGRSLGTALTPDGPVVSTEVLIGFAVLAAIALMPVAIRRWRRARKAAN